MPTRKISDQLGPAQVSTTQGHTSGARSPTGRPPTSLKNYSGPTARTPRSVPKLSIALDLAPEKGDKCSRHGDTTSHQRFVPCVRRQENVSELCATRVSAACTGWCSVDRSRRRCRGRLRSPPGRWLARWSLCTGRRPGWVGCAGVADSAMPVGRSATTASVRCFRWRRRAHPLAHRWAGPQSRCPGRGEPGLEARRSRTG